MRRRDEILLYQRDSVKAKAALYVKTDVEGRRHREQTGLDTQVVFAVNDECHRLDKKFLRRSSPQTKKNGVIILLIF